MTLVAPSILAADFMNLARDIKKVEDAGADYLHIDVMDGSYVPNITFGIDMVSQISKVATIPLDVHLMIINPEKYVEKFAQAGAEFITVHAEACVHLHYVIQLIKKAGCKAGVALNPGTSATILEPVLNDVDLVLQMTVNPGFGGQAFIPSTLDNIRYLDNQRKNKKGNYLIQVDGGINQETSLLVKQAGADFLVAGSYLYGNENIPVALAGLKK